MPLGRDASGWFPGSSWRGLLLTAALVAVCLTGLTRSLWTPDEPREAAISRAMAEHPSFVPTLNGTPFCEKPPLYYWVVAGVFKVTGEFTPEAARAVSAASSLLTLLLVFIWARRAFGNETAWLAAVMMGTSLQFLQTSHWILLDPMLALAATAALWAMAERLRGGGPGWLVLLYGAASAALFIKGPIGPLLIFLGPCLYLLVRRKRGEWRRLSLPWGVLALSCVAALCAWGFYASGGAEALREFLLLNQIDRFFHPETTGHARPFHYYFGALPAAVLPWLAPFAALFFPSFWKRLREDARPEPFVLASTVAAGFAFLSLSASKREIYLLPLLPPLFILMGLAAARFAEDWGEMPTKRKLALFGILQTLTLVVWTLAAPVGIMAFTKRVSPLAVALLAAGLTAAVAGGAACFRRGLKRAFPPFALAALTGAAAMVVLAGPALNPQKDMTPFVRWVDVRVPPGPVAAVGADETLCGIIPFVTGREVLPVGPEEFRRLKEEGHPPPFIVERVDPDLNPPDLAANGYELLKEQEFGRKRIFRLWRLKSAGPEPGESPAGGLPGDP
jgi:4-amino-4-deoxy-L-arabinose transferase-like glycosyltransferase